MKQKRILLAALLALLLVFAVGGTAAYLADNTADVTNTFVPTQVSCEIDETLSGNTKTSIRVQNTSPISVYIRVALIPYWQDADGHVAGIPSWPLPSFTLNDGWFRGNDGYYYYQNPVSAGEYTPSLTNHLALPAQEGVKAVLTVAAEAIQAEGGAVTVTAAGWTVQEPN